MAYGASKDKPESWPNDKGEARERLGMGGGKPAPSSDSGFGRWLRRREKRKETLLTIPFEPDKPTPETTQPRVVTDSADIELSQTIGETKNDAERAELDRDQRKHLLFRTHRYLPSMTTPRNAPVGQNPQLAPGAYENRRIKGARGRQTNLVNMANDPDRRN